MFRTGKALTERLCGDWSNLLLILFSVFRRHLLEMSKCFFEGVVNHHSLTMHTLTNRSALSSSFQIQRVPRTIAFGSIFVENRMIRDVNFDENIIYDELVWRKFVKPIKERNGVLGFVKKFHNMQNQMIRAHFYAR